MADPGPDPLARIEVNPYEQHCLNYTVPEYAPFHDLYVAAHPEEDPVAALIAIWQAGNERAKADWDTQLEADQAHVPHQPPMENPPGPRANSPAPKEDSSVGSMELVEDLQVDTLLDKVCAYT